MSSLIFLALTSIVSRAQPSLTVKVDSFVSTGRANIAAEICGHVEGGSKAVQQILIVTDPKSKGPGKYVALSTFEGEFCAVVATVFGQAEVSILGTPTIQSVKVSEFTNQHK